MSIDTLLHCSQHNLILAKSTAREQMYDWHLIALYRLRVICNNLPIWKAWLGSLHLIHVVRDVACEALWPQLLGLLGLTFHHYT